MFERTFLWNNNNKSELPKSRYTLLFTGISLSFYLKVKVDEKEEDEDDWETFAEINISKNNDKMLKNLKPMTVKLIPGFTINFEEESIFDPSRWEYLMR